MNSNAHHDYERESNQVNGNRYEQDENEQSTGDLIWNRALSKLRYKIMPKLKLESIEGDQLSSTNKKEKVDVHIETDFQMAYFFRKVSGKHAVLLKQKELRFPESVVAAQRQQQSSSNEMMPPPLLPASAMLQRSGAADSMPVSRLPARESNQTNNVLSEGSRISNEEPPVQIEEEDDKPTNLKRSRGDEGNGSSDIFSHTVRIKQEDEDDDDVQIVDSIPIAAAQEQQNVDAMQDDKKPHLHVDYSGFRIFGKCFIVVIEPTKRTKRLRSSLFQTTKPVERHQLSATPVPRQYRETPTPRSIQSTPIRQTNSIDPDEGDENEAATRSDSRRNRMCDGLFRGTSSDWTPTPTPEPERRTETSHRPSTIAASSSTLNIDSTDEDNDDDPDNSSSVMLATQMLEGDIAGQGNDIDDD